MPSLSSVLKFALDAFIFATLEPLACVIMWEQLLRQLSGLVPLVQAFFNVYVLLLQVFNPGFFIMYAHCLRNFELWNAQRLLSLSQQAPDISSASEASTSLPSKPDNMFSAALNAYLWFLLQQGQKGSVFQIFSQDPVISRLAQAVATRGFAGKASAIQAPNALAQMPITAIPSMPLSADVSLGLADSCITYQLHLLGAYVFFGDLTPTAGLPGSSFLIQQLCWDLALSCYYTVLEAGLSTLTGGATLSGILSATRLHMDSLFEDPSAR
jgi:hypothetical protein